MRRPPLSDLVLATVLGGGTTVLEAMVAADRHWQWAAVLNVLIHAALTVALAVRHVFLRASFIATYALLAALAVVVAVAPSNLGITPLLVCAPLSLYLVARHEPPAWGVAALLLGLVGTFVSPTTRTPSIGQGFAGAHVLILVGTYLWASGRRRAEDEYARRLAAERERLRADAVAAVARAEGEERTRIAREVHDVVAHSLTTVQVQASTALAIGTDAASREALAAIKESSADALAEVRSLVRVLRAPPETDVTGDVRGLDELVRRTRAAGLDVRATLPTGARLDALQSGWDAATRLTLVRVVQESLTNALKHGGPRPSLTLSVDVRDDRVSVRASNPSRTTNAQPGYGLRGLRERVEAVGGAFTAGPDGDGFTLNADLPAPPNTPATEEAP